MRLGKCFDTLGSRGEGALAAYIPLASRDFSHSMAVAEAYVRGGVDILQVGIPAPYPFLDGRTMAMAHLGAKKENISPQLAFAFCKELRCLFPRHPIVPMLFLSAVIEMGIGASVQLAQAADVDALDTPDYPFATLTEGYYKELACAKNLPLINLLSTDMLINNPEQARDIIRVSSGFIFLLLTSGGLTGTDRDLLLDALPMACSNLQHIKAELNTSLPVLAVCGIDGPEKVRDLMQIPGIDGVLVGSAVVEKVLKGVSYQEISDFCRSLKSSLKNKGV